MSPCSASIASISIYGAAQALRSVSLKAGDRTNLMRARPQRRRQVVAFARHRRPARHRFRLDPMERQGNEYAAQPPAGEGRLRLRAAGARDFPLLSVQGEPPDRFRDASAATSAWSTTRFSACFPFFPTCWGGAAAICPAGSSSSWPSPRPVTDPKVLILDEPTEGIQP